jgi:COP9 signalosome complex subunit 7
MQKLDIELVRDLEDILIEAIYANLIHAKINQRQELVEANYVCLGDINVQTDVPNMIAKLDSFLENARNLKFNLEERMNALDKNHNQVTQEKREFISKLESLYEASLQKQGSTDTSSFSSQFYDVRYDSVNCCVLIIYYIDGSMMFPFTGQHFQIQSPNKVFAFL